MRKTATTLILFQLMKKYATKADGITYRLIRKGGEEIAMNRRMGWTVKQQRDNRVAALCGQ